VLSVVLSAAADVCACAAVLCCRGFSTSPVENFNDVWASSDAGLTWAEINHAARLAQRGFYDLDITSEGVLIVSAGRADNSTAYMPTRRNASG
jgi:hypothetical protein